ncbi:hypothetical protein LTR36_000348 [Oleoguttula mirabilis]|uniref:Uncharacterized protein n=1 Tax=Oleoguttula mirabilis TaxID=1507867 RepID=A0AAV9K1I2_9PEZI|nr:hypothetical protein LTR36_000348 [Oleoguttula mirabilis]
MLSISFSVSLLAEHWEYRRGLDGDDDKRKVPSRHQQRRRSVDGLPRTTEVREVSAGARSQQQSPTANSAYNVDTSYASLSEQTQDMQLRARKCLEGKRRERIADANSLGLLEGATTRAAVESMIATLNDRESLRVLQDVHKRGRHQLVLPMGSDWCLIGPPSNTTSSRIHSLNATPLSWDPSGTTVSTPKTPAVGVSSPKQPHPEDTIPEQDQPPEHVAKAETESMQVPDHAVDPFDSHLVEGSQEQEARLRDSLAEYTMRQVETVHDLFDTLRKRDEEQEASPLEAAESVEGVCGSSASGALISSVHSRSESYGHKSSSGADDTGSALPTKSSVGKAPWWAAGENELQGEASMRGMEASPEASGQDVNKEEEKELERGGSMCGADSSPEASGQELNKEEENEPEREGSMCGADSSAEANVQESDWDDDDEEDDKVVREGLPKAEPDEVEDDWLLI